MQTLAFIEINPQLGFNNTQIDASPVPYVLGGVLIGIVFAKWFL